MPLNYQSIANIPLSNTGKKAACIYPAVALCIGPGTPILCHHSFEHNVTEALVYQACLV